MKVSPGRKGHYMTLTVAIGPRQADLVDVVPMDVDVLSLELVVHCDHDHFTPYGMDGWPAGLTIDGHHPLVEKTFGS